MAGRHAVRMRIVDVRKRCPQGHRVGQEWIVDGRTPEGICLGSFGACLPYLTALRFGASFPWETEAGAITIGCPDCENEVIWRLERVEAAGPAAQGS
jgi:uncharacterized repeat protein (TIGR04076 family)